MRRFGLACILLSSCASQRAATDADLRRALAGVTPESLLEPIKTLASDAFEGRAPGSEGERKTVEYLVAEFKRRGLSPGVPARSGESASYTQPVPLVGFVASPEGSFQ